MKEKKSGHRVVSLFNLFEFIYSYVSFIQMKVVLIIIFIKYNIYFTFEYLIFEAIAIFLEGYK